MDVYDTYLVLSFVGETRVLGLNEDDELDEADIEGFDAQVQVRQQVRHPVDDASFLTHALLTLIAFGCADAVVQQCGTQSVFASVQSERAPHRLHHKADGG